MEKKQNVAMADDLIKKGDKKLKGSFLGNMMSSKDLRAESAAELYKQGAINYKLGQEWEKASQAYLKCAQCDDITRNGEKAELLVEAGNMMKKVNIAEGVGLIEQASQEYCQEGRLV